MNNHFQEFERQIRIEKSEIKELKEAYDIVQDHLVKAEQKLRDKDKLITELCDALYVARGSVYEDSLIRRAREVTK